MHWIKEALTKFPEPPNRTNHTALHGPIFNLWDRAQNEEAMEEFGDHEGNAHLDQMEGEGPVKFSSEKPLELASLSTNGEYVADRVSEPSNHKFGGNQQTLQERHLDMNKVALSRRIPMKSLLRKLRWATVGLQFDWSKVSFSLLWLRFASCFF
jgi:alkylated DNA repair protein alkB family protein 1